jgi:cytoskeletal protein RodZ
MTAGDEEGNEGKQPPEEEEDNRGIENAVMLAFFVVLVAAGIWLLYHG